MSDGRSRIYWAFIALLVVLYFILTLGIGLSEGVPDLLTVAVLLAARRMPGAGAAGLGLALGLVRDSVGVAAFGAGGVVLTALGYLGARTRDIFEGDSLIFTALYLFLGKWLHDVVYALLSGGVRGGVVDLMVTDAPIAAGYAALAGVVALVLYRMTARAR